MHQVLPLSVQHFIRDTGLLGTAVDAATMATASVTLATRPTALRNLLRATASARIGVAYGERPEHRVDIFEPPGVPDSPVVIFVHGGAWGSGSRLIYRLVGQRFCDEGFTTVLVGYRRYPRANIDEMVDDIALAIKWASERPEWSQRARHVVGHSSGAHVATMAVLRRARSASPPLCASLVGVSGVYDIARHFEFEARRGVHEISPMKPAAGGAFGFASASPSVVAPQLSAAQASHMPPVLLVHGSDDTTVPYTSTLAMAGALRAAGCRDVEDVVLLEKGHADFMLELSGLVEERRFARMRTQAASGDADATGSTSARIGLPMAGTGMRTLDPVLKLFARCAHGSQTESRGTDGAQAKQGGQAQRSKL
jgi:acetyl esterase/lipase